MKRLLFLQLAGTPEAPESNRTNVPFAAGVLAAYLKDQGFAADIVIPDHQIISKFGDERLVRYIVSKRPTHLLLTLYMWNIERSFYIASVIKNRLPNCKIIVGGPEVSTDNAWIFENKNVDHFVCGEGEIKLYNLLAKKDLRRVIDGSEAVDKLKSPYLAGTLKMNPRENLYIETVRGCPFNCTFCHYPKGRKKQSELSVADLGLILKKAAKKGVRDIIFTDPTFNSHPSFSDILDTLITHNRGRRFKYHAEIKPHTLTGEEIAKIKKAGFATLEVGLQTINKKTQEKIKCIIPLEKFKKNLKTLGNKISIRLDLIAGLPDENLEDIKRGLNYVRKNFPKADCYLYNLSVLPGTEMRKVNLSSPLKYQQRPPYFVAENGAIDKVGIYNANRYFEKLFREELDPQPYLDEIYRDRKKLGCIIITDKDLKRGANVNTAIPPFAVVLFKLKRASEETKAAIAEVVKRLTSRNPFSSFVFFVQIPDADHTEISELIMKNASVEYNQYANNSLIYSREQITNLRIGFPSES